MASATRCPDCGERVSAFAGGCALCGADLDAHRARLQARPRLATTPVRHVRRPSAAGIDPDAALIGITVVLLVFSPLVGTLLAGLGAFDRHRRGTETARNVFLVLLGLGLVSFFAPWQTGLLGLF